jgi:hypothetical protein
MSGWESRTGEILAAKIDVARKVRLLSGAFSFRYRRRAKIKRDDLPEYRALRESLTLQDAGPATEIKDAAEGSSGSEFVKNEAEPIESEFA